jgi:GNAT superfamily N-acetyltransferase
MDAHKVTFREAGAPDVPAMVAGRLADPAAGAPDERMAAYLEGRHHPREALPPRTAFVAEHDGMVVGYIAGHLTRRRGCEGEVQYLFVASRVRRSGVGSRLLERLARWFATQGARKIGVNVDPESEGAGAFYARHGAVPRSTFWSEWEDIGVLFNR